MRNHAAGHVTILAVSGLSMNVERFGKAITAEGWRAVLAEGREGALQILQSDVVDVVVFDGSSAATEGAHQTIRHFIATQPDAPVVLITASAMSEHRLEALRAGAFQVLCEPVEGEELIFAIGRALEHRHLVLQHRNLRQLLFWDSQHTSLVGDSPAMREIRRQIAACAGGHSPVLIEGEPGTGKELAARILHFAGPGQDQPFLTVRCRAPREALETELFGQTRTAFAFGPGPKRGALEEASGGTIHLDEVCQMDASVQSKLLRACRTNSVRVASSRKALPIHVRIVASSLSSLAGLVRRGRFNPELSEFLRATEISMAPLRDRIEDIASLAQHFLGQHEKRSGKRGFPSSEALLMLQLHDWPGNVEELKGSIDWAMEQNVCEVLKPEDFPPEVQGVSRRGARAEDFYAGLPSLEGLTKRYISYVVRTARGNKAEAAAILGISRQDLYRRAARLGQKARKNTAASSPGSDMLAGLV